MPDFTGAFRWYRQTFGMDIPIFEDSGVAGLMFRYTGGKPQARHALLAGNLQGGSALEIWQFTSRKTEAPKFTVLLGDLGIFAVKIKVYDIYEVFSEFKDRGHNVLSRPTKGLTGKHNFFMKDPLGLIFEIIEGEEWFARGKHLTGGVCGCLIGVSDFDKACTLYKDILGYDEILYDDWGVFEDLMSLPGGCETVRRVLLAHSRARKGGFSRWLGPSRIELIQACSRKPRKIFEKRFWGDLGFIHLCFDVCGMELLKAECEEKGFPFTVDSSESFDMGDASGRFSYIEDPDGTLIEFVETHRIPIVKKLGWYLDLTRRDPEKPLPDWLLKALSLNRVRD